ncbi:mitochondrial import inner membrane translocase subunit Tim21-like [Mizuhopecten yessoensis]|uniref:Mitochondrial import inner membrane translocase subunit Tim21 n=1 Tax=Mizuhopecten yessoensis TaxID=6573 RepID=A0A210PLR8_MIZYE|nr:mitochondrial import inner membrane translocase subunit Tim21-like [Mizuhopecten yessoensis]OWF37366.1 Mitochondrial import inner membrane translocase subunit Tim21 [Mizuhopecten yessoensis]
MQSFLSNSKCLLKAPLLCRSQKIVSFVICRQPLLHTKPPKHLTSVWCQKCLISTSAKGYAKPKKNNEIDVARESPFSELTFQEKVKEAGKTSFWGGIILCGVGVTGALLYIIGKEVFSSQSPRGIYSNAFELCKQNTELMDVLGEPVKCYGEETRRGRRRHTSHVEFEQDGMQHMKMVFYVEGHLRKGKVHLAVQKTPGQKYEYRYLFVELYGYPSRTIVIQDNR